MASVFPGLVKVEQRFHDAGGAVAKQTATETTFDLRGNPVKVVDLGEPGPADDTVAETTFTKCDPHPSFPWTQVPQELRILDGAGSVLRRRVGDTPCDYAAIVALDEHLTPSGDGDRAHTEVGYVDPGGQVGPVIGPANHRGQTDDVTYTYDPVTGYLVNVKDAHGLETKATWNNKFGRLVSVTDPNGAMTSYEYDDRGRLASMTGPLQQGGPATVTFDYHAEDPDPWVLAANFDPANPDNRIDTVRFIDGVEKEIQRKHDATVFDGPAAPARDVMVVSGSTYFDALWRPVRQFYSITEPLGTPGVYNATDDTAALPTVTTYDVRDRPTEVVAPGDRVTTTTYGYDDGPFASVMFAEDVVDPEDKRTRRYLDARDNVVGVERFRGPAQTETLSLTRFRYDPIQQLVEISDPGNALTRISFDLLGRQTAVDGPDTGLVEMGYDLAGNQTSRVTPNLRADRQAITYEFDVTRLVKVTYPDDRSNDVVFRYGGPDDEAAVRANAVGRIATSVNGSRIQNRTYDKAGNLVEQRDVMKVKNLNRATQPRHTYTTKFVRDHWGRILNMTYPDGEVVTSAYDSGGLVRSVAGVKGPHRYDYVDRMEYDKFGSRRFAAYGNGVVTADDYDSRTLWLSSQVVTRQGAELQDLRYTYDKVGNVTERLDDIPVPPASEKGGPSRQTFGYDDLYRLTSASGTYSFAPDKRRDYSLALSYDPAGRVASKKQTDTTFQSSGSSTPEKDTTYELAYEYSDDRPHAPTRAGSRTLNWDANGNNTGWQQDQGGQRRTITWDEENRAASISDQGNTTEYRYGHDGTLGVERGPLGEVEYVNPWYTALNGGVAWKDVFADDLRVATKRVLDGPEEHQRYFLTGDLIGSVNLVTDAGGKLFEHLEDFPGGEIWVRERSEIYRQPHLYAGMYHDEARTLYRTDARWYERREGVLLSPDLMLVTKPTEAIAEPRLLHDYAYGFDNPVRYVDPVGLSATEAILRFTEGNILVPFKADAQLKARKEFKSKHPIAAKRIGKGTKTLKKVTDFFDDIQSISFDVTVGPKGIKVKKIKIFKIKVFKAKPPPKAAAKKT